MQLRSPTSFIIPCNWLVFLFCELLAVLCPVIWVWTCSLNYFFILGMSAPGKNYNTEQVTTVAVGDFGGKNSMSIVFKSIVEVAKGRGTKFKHRKSK